MLLYISTMSRTWAPPLLITKLQLSSLSRFAPARFIVPRQVWAISAWDLWEGVLRGVVGVRVSGGGEGERG